MDIHEDSIPFSFTPDGLDEAVIDALIDEAYAQVGGTFQVSADIPERRPVRRRASKRSPNGQAA
jgi:hypothetical protein